jgi:hypothetical protein
MSATNATDGQDDTAAGRIIVTVASSVSAILVILGLIYWTGADQRHAVEMTTFKCEPSVFIAGLPCTSEPMLASQYNAILTPAAKLIDADIIAYTVNERHHLIAAEAALTAEVTTENTFDTNLAAMTFTPQNRARALALITSAADAGNPVPPAAVTFTPQITVIADALIKADQALATLTAEQARATSLTTMRSFNHPVQLASAAVQAEMDLILKAIDTPPTWS